MPSSVGLGELASDDRAGASLETEIPTRLPPEAAAGALRRALEHAGSATPFEGSVEGRTFQVRCATEPDARRPIALRGRIVEAPCGSIVLVRAGSRTRGELEVTVSAAAVVVGYTAALASVLGYAQAAVFVAVPALLTAAAIASERREWRAAVVSLRSILPPPDRRRSGPYR